MKLTAKKIFAREFLILTVAAVLGLVAFVCTYPYNSYQQHQADKLTTTINDKAKLADSLSKPFDNKTEQQNWLHSKVLEEYDVSKDPDYTREKIWEILSDFSQKDSIKFRWTTIWSDRWTPFFKKAGFDTPEKLKKYVETNSINSTDNSNKQLATKNIQEVNSLTNQKAELQSKVLSFNKQIDFGIKSLIVFAILLFALRYLYYGIKWSVRTLNQKQDDNF